MLGWTIFNIEADNFYDVVNSSDVLIPTGPQCVWDRATIWPDGPTGSIRPVIFCNGMDAETWTPISMTGSASFPASWRDGGYYTVVGYLNRKEVFKSALNPVPPKHDFVVVKGMFLSEPNFSSRLVSIPFRYGGDFTWVLYLYKSEVYLNEYMVSDCSTRLELCWARTDPPKGPLVSSSATERTRVDMSPGYPIVLWRLFAPSPSELPDDPNLDVVTYIQRAIITVIWNPCSTKPRYDTNSGSPYYGVSSYGGGFSLKDWVNATYERCNCYDVAGISQLACSLLMDNDGNELANSNWVLQSPNGYINPGPLIGWVKYGADHLRCNSPFWESWETNPYVDPDDPNRNMFSNHAWVEVAWGGHADRVLDACHAFRGIPPRPHAGELTRQEYLDQALDQRLEHGNGKASTADDSTGDCHLSPDSSLTRIGVYNPWGQYVNVVPTMKPELAAEIAQLVEAGKSPHEVERVHNSKSLRPSELSRVLGHPIGPKSSVTAFPGVVRAVASFQRSTNTTIVATITASSDLNHPMNELITYLAGFQMHPLSSVVRTDHHHLGAYSFRKENGMFWIRGNMFIRLEQFSDHDAESTFDTDLAISLDAYLAEQPDSSIPPGSDLIRRPFPDTVMSCKTIKVGLYTRLRDLATAKSTSDDANIIVPGGPPDENGLFSFHARLPGTTTCHIIAAAQDTFFPESTSFEITVIPDSEFRDPGPTKPSRGIVPITPPWPGKKTFR